MKLNQKENKQKQYWFSNKCQKTRRWVMHIRYKRLEEVKPIDESKDYDENETCCYEKPDKWNKFHDGTAGMLFVETFLLYIET